MQSGNEYKEMKDAIKKAGGLFYQYRSCKMDNSTIYDIENIQNGVIYAQTPLNMNDPFDSKLGFSEERIIDEAIELTLKKAQYSDKAKKILIALLKNDALGKMEQFLSDCMSIYKSVLNQKNKMHQNGMSDANFLKRNIDILYKKMPKNIKEKYNKEMILILFTLLCMSNIDVNSLNEDKLLKIASVNQEYQNLKKEVLEYKNEKFPQLLDEFISKITVSCFTASGWDNQLMWSHYADSYKGICVEYDFSKMDKFIGFFKPVVYTKKRPTLSLSDITTKLGTDNVQNEDSRNKIDRILSFLLCKNECWSYEKEWRLLNFGESNSPQIINVSFIKSVTLGLKIPPLYKHFIFDICEEKEIQCYKLVINSQNYNIERVCITREEISQNYQDELEYCQYLMRHITVTIDVIKNEFHQVIKSYDSLSQQREMIKKWAFNLNAFLSNIYFLKRAMNTSALIEYQTSQSIATINDIHDTINSIDQLISSLGEIIQKIERKSQEHFVIKNYAKETNEFKNLRETIDKINNMQWLCVSYTK